MASEKVYALSDIKSIIKSLLISTADLHNLDTLNVDFKKCVGNYIPFRKYGYSSLIDFLKSMPDILNLVRTGTGQVYITYQSNNINSQHIADMISKQKKKLPTTRRHTRYNGNSSREHFNPIQFSGLSERVNKNSESNRITKIVEDFANKEFSSSGSNGSSVNHITQKNVEHFENKEICSSGNNGSANNITQMVQHEEMIDNFENMKISDKNYELCVICAKNQDSKDFFYRNEKSNGASNAINFDSESEWRGNEEHANFLLNIQPSQLDIAFDIPNSIFPDDVTIKKLHQIVITHVHNPYRFWFRFKTKSFPFTNLNIELNKFCERDIYKRWKFKQQYHTAGTACCICYQNNWYRAKFLQRNLNEAKLYLVDAGMVIYVNVEHIRYLPQQFASAPSQAFRGSLEGIQPIDKRWSQQSVSDLFKMSSSNDIKANIRFVANNTAYLLAFDTSKDSETQFFNELFLNTKLAVRSEENDHFQNKFPTFEMIENAEYPSITEIRNMYNSGIRFSSNELKLFENFENINEVDLRELFLHFKSMLISQEVHINENCLVYKKIKCKNMEFLNLNKSVSENNEIYKKVSQWADEYNSKHNF